MSRLFRISSKSILILLIFIFTVNTFEQSRGQKAESVQMNYELYRLNNGLQVLLQPDSGVNEVSVEFWLKVGIRDEAAEKYGLAHFFEHVTPYGFLNKTKELELFKTYRTDSNAQVKKDFIRYYTKVKPEGLDLALQYTAERLNAKSSDIDNEKVETQRVRVLAEIERNSKNPFWSAEGGTAFYAATFGQTHPYGHGGYGTVKNNENFKLADLRKWYDEYVRPDNVILFVVGNFDTKEAKKYIKKHFGGILAKSKNLKKAAIPKVNQTGENFTVQTAAENHYLALSWAIPGWGSEEDGSFRILANILDERLKDESKQTKEIVKTSAADLLDMYQYAGQFGIYASFSNRDDKAKIESFLEKEIKNLIESGITETELKAAKQKELQTIQEMKKNLGFQSSRTELLGEGLLFKNKPDFYFTRLKKQNKLKKEDIERIAKTWLGKEPSKVFFESASKSKVEVR